MKRIMIFLVSFMFLTMLTSPLYPGEYTATLSADGKKITFPPKQGVLDLDISGITLELTDVPPEAQFMVGKVYGGHFRHARYRGEGNAAYIFLLKWNAATNDIFLSRAESPRGASLYIPAKHVVISCPPRFTEDFSCVQQGKTDKSAADFYTFRFSIKNGKPVLDVSGGSYIEFVEAGVLPDQIAHK